jgi:ABC-2 type transport system ATP-binding protein
VKDALLSLESLSKNYGQQIILKELSLELRSHTFYGLSGKNGTGKSTLMQILMGIQSAETPLSGVLFEKKITRDHQIRSKALMAYVSESIDYGFPLPLQKLFSIFPKLYPNWNETLFQSVVLNLNIPINRAFSSLSRGQKMQIAFAISLATQPKILFIDEITSVLDSYARRYVLKLAQQYVEQGGCVLMASNIISEMEGYAHHFFVLDEGQFLIDADVTEIPQLFVKLRQKVQDSPPHPIFEKPECIEVGRNSDGSFSFLISRSDLPPDLPLADLEDRRAVQLEEVFVYLTRKNYENLYSS